jgi:hypothetical protein
MAIDLTLKSVAITNREATPRVPNNPGNGGQSGLRCVSSYLASVTAALTITSVIRMVEVPAHAYVKQVWFQSLDQTAGKFDVGVYRTNADGGAVVDVDLFAAALDCASAVAKADKMLTSTTLTIAKQHMPLWQAAAVASPGPPPGTMYDIALTVVDTDVTTGTTPVAVEAYYTI